MDNLEKYISTNKKALDEKVRRKEKMWAEIDKELNKKKAKTFNIFGSRFLKIAASFLIIALIANAIIMYNQNSLQREQSFAQASELSDVNNYYTQLISYKVEQVNSNPELSLSDKREFLSFINEMDEDYEQLKLEFEKDVNSDRILNEIIQNYRRRLSLLEHFLTRLNNTKIEDNEQSISL